MVNKGDLIVFDQEFNYASKQIREYGNELTRRMNRYCEIVLTIMNAAIQDELITAQLTELVDKVMRARIYLGSAEGAAKACTSYVQEIDKADQFLY